MGSIEASIKQQRNKVVELLGVLGTPDLAEINKLKKCILLWSKRRLGGNKGRRLATKW